MRSESQYINWFEPVFVSAFNNPKEVAQNEKTFRKRKVFYNDKAIETWLSTHSYGYQKPPVWKIWSHVDIVLVSGQF